MRLGIDASNIRVGGGLTHLLEVLKVARPQDYGITRVVVWTRRKTMKLMPSKGWLEVIDEPMLDRPLPVRLFWRRARLHRLAKEFCDVLFVPGGAYEGTFKPYVTFSQNLLPFERGEMGRYGWSWTAIRLRLLRLSHTKSFRNANGVIFLTENSRSVIMGQTGPFSGHQTIIPYGLDERFRLAPRPQQSIDHYSPDKPFRFLYISIVDLYKHQWHVAEAVARLRQMGLPVALDLVGAAYEPARRHLEDVMAKVDPGGEYIRYHGPVPYAELHEVYHRADAFIFASTCESLPNILLEAMASGLPIACSNREPMPEVLSNTGLYFDPENPQDISDALHSLVMSPELRAQYAAAAFERARNYSWERCAKETFSFLAEVGQNSIKAKD